MSTDALRYAADGKSVLCSAISEIIPTVALINVTYGEEPEIRCAPITMVVTNRKLPRIVIGILALKAVEAVVRLPDLGQYHVQL